MTLGSESQRKLPYTTPHLMVYGDLSELTLAKGSNMAEGGHPSTKA